MFRQHNKLTRLWGSNNRDALLYEFKATQVFCRSFSPTSVSFKKQEQADNSPKQQHKRPSPGKISLRRVSIEAERSRTKLIIKKDGRRFIDPDVDTKTVAAYCAAEQYNIQTASKLLREAGYSLDPYRTGLFPQVIHIEIPFNHLGSTNSSPTKQAGDVLVFPSGTVVSWNLPERVALKVIQAVLPPAAINSHSTYIEVEKEDMQFIEDSTTDRSSIVGDTIVIGTKSEPERTDDDTNTSPEVETLLAKIAFSSGLARSTKLAVLERLTDAYFESTRTIPLILSKGSPLPVRKPRSLARLFELLGFGSRLPFSRSFILRKTGELLNIRAQLNLYSELTDSLPDMFWDSRHELGLEGYYELVGRALDVGVRIKVLNEKMDYAQEIASVLRETLSERHNLRLEWGIIVLIAIEVLFEFSNRLKSDHAKE